MQKPLLNKSIFGRRPLLHGGIQVLAVKLANALIGFLVVLILARHLGVEHYGIYAYAYALVNLATIPIRLGFPQVIVRETAKSLYKNDLSSLKGVWIYSARLCVTVYLAVLVFFVFFLLVFKFPDFERYGLLLGSSAVLMFSMAALGIGGSMLRGLGFPLAGQLPELMARPILFLFGVLLLLLLAAQNIEKSASIVMLIHAIASVIALSIAAIMIKARRPPGLMLATPNFSSKRAWIRSAWPLSLMALMNYGNHHADLLLVGLFMSPADVAIYRVVAQVGSLVILGQAAINSYIAPSVARDYAAGNIQEVMRSARVGAVISCLFSLLIYVPIVLSKGEFFTIAFGEDYYAAILPFAILGAGQIVNAAMGSIAIVLSMTGHERAASQSTLIACVTNVLLNLLLIPRLGLLGAAISTAFALLLWNLLLARSLKNALGVTIGVIGR